MDQLRMFLSHSSQDKAAADHFAQAFRQAGADVWYDEENLGAGHLRRAIMKELGERPVFVVLLSHAALASSWVLDECEWAYDLQGDDPSRVILPVVVESLERADLNVALYLRSLKRVEAGALRPFPIAEATTQALRLLGMTPAGQSPTPSVPQSSESAADLVLRGKGLTAQRKYTEALPLFQRATQLAPDSFDSWMNLGFTLRQLKTDKEDALASYEHAIALDASQANAWTGKGLALYDLRRYSEALAAFERATQLDSGRAFAWNGKGVALHRLGQDNDALKAFEEAISRNSKIALFWGNKANSLRALGREAEAQEAERRVKKLGG